jgi:Pvc16 N-terminal domain
VSNAYAIAAVTATLRKILDEGVKDFVTSVTILPLDKANDANGGPQLNLFLYHVARNAAWINRDMPRHVQPGETSVPPLPLDLHYLITAYANPNALNKLTDHTLLGHAMRVLHDHPLLSAEDIKAATHGMVDPIPESDLDQQIERIRITQLPMPVDEASKLWTSFATNYRLSAAYQVGVALIESTRGARAPLPVLTRGQDDSGVGAEASLASPLPTLDTLTPPDKQTSVRLQETITLAGIHLAGVDVALRFEHARLAAPIESAPDPGATDTLLEFTLPNQPAVWPAGFYTVTALVQRTGETYHRTTNQLFMALAPTLTNIASIFSPGSTPDTRNGTITLTVAPEVWLGQRAALLLGDREILADLGLNPPPQTHTLEFKLTDVPVGPYFVRLRVDGVDSLLIDKSTTLPTFDTAQQVNVT